MNSDEQIRDTAAQVINVWRLRRKMSQSELAKKLGMHQTAIAKIENGERRIDFSTVVKIADVLRIPWDEFNVSAPTDFEVFIQHFSKFEQTALQWVSDVKTVYTSIGQLEPVMDDILTYIAPSRIQLSEEITEEEFHEATNALVEIHGVILRTLKSLEGLEAATEIESKIGIISDFVEKLEKVKNDAES